MVPPHQAQPGARVPATSQRYRWAAPAPTQPTNPSASPARKAAARISAAAAKTNSNRASKNFASAPKPLDSSPAAKRKAAPVAQAVDPAAASAGPVDSVAAARSPSVASDAASTSTSRTASSIFPTTTPISTRSPIRSPAFNPKKPATISRASAPTSAARSTFRTFSMAATRCFSSSDGTARAAARLTMRTRPFQPRPNASAISPARHIMTARPFKFSIPPPARSSPSTASPTSSTLP